MNEFESWFVAQFGERESDFKNLSDGDLDDICYKGTCAEEELMRRVTWDHQWSAAKAAWRSSD